MSVSMRSIGDARSSSKERLVITEKAVPDVRHLHRRRGNMAEFKVAFMFTLHHEDPSGSGKVTEDVGGRTRFGIAAKFHPDLPEDFLLDPWRTPWPKPSGSKSGNIGRLCA